MALEFLQNISLDGKSPSDSNSPKSSSPFEAPPALKAASPDKGNTSLAAATSQASQFQVIPGTGHNHSHHTRNHHHHHHHRYHHQHSSPTDAFHFLTNISLTGTSSTQAGQRSSVHPQWAAAVSSRTAVSSSAISGKARIHHHHHRRKKSKLEPKLIDNCYILKRRKQVDASNTKSRQPRYYEELCNDITNREFLERRIFLRKRQMAAPFAVFSCAKYRDDSESSSDDETTLISALMEGAEVKSLLEPGSTNKDKYDPFYIDDPAFQSGKSRVMKKPGLTASVLGFVVSESEQKKKRNEEFLTKHDWLPPRLTLTKIRRVKNLILQVIDELQMEISTAALAHYYFELLVIEKKVKVENRRLLGACALFLAIKFNESCTSKKEETLHQSKQRAESGICNLCFKESPLRTVSVLNYSALVCAGCVPHAIKSPKDIFGINHYRSRPFSSIWPVFEEHMRVSKKELLSCEYAVLVAIGFSLHGHREHLMPHFERILTTKDTNLQKYLDDMKEDLRNDWENEEKIPLPDECV